MSAVLYIEGGGEGKDNHSRCREGFRKLLEKCGFEGKLPRLVACGGRESAFDGFKTALQVAKKDDYIGLLVDSEDPVENIDQPWAHLAKRDKWKRPKDVEEDQALLMTTCMETWIACDQETLSSHYGQCLQTSALPKRVELELQGRKLVLDKLEKSTRTCGKDRTYQKGKHSFELLGKIQPKIIQPHLPSFQRMVGILKMKLG